jgi:hypothetical protein
MQKILGTHYYVAPEDLRGEYMMKNAIYGV